jgi:D-alanyl-D-alanine dipeptidase
MKSPSRAALVVAACLALAGCATPSAQQNALAKAAEATPAPPVVPTPSPRGAGTEPAPAGWVDLADIDPTILVELRYHGSHNFVGRPVAGYVEARCLLPAATARALATAQRAAVADGYRLKVYDCYRPLRAGADFLAWRDSGDEAMRAEFYPELSKDAVFARGFVAGGRSNHSAGAAVDVTLVRMPPAKQPAFRPGDPLVACTAPERFADNSVDMGTGYDCFDARSRTLDPRITGVARENRLLLRRVMAAGGFSNYANEWWHYDLFRPTQWFDFPVEAAVLREP